MNKKNFLTTKDLFLGWVGIFFGLLGLITTLSFLFYRTNLLGKASLLEQPQNLRLSNLSSNSVTISWITKSQTIASVVYSQKKDLSSSLTAFDDRGAETSSSLHVITLKDLYPSTTYYFRLVSGGQEFDNNGVPYTFSTAPHLATTPNLPFIIKGKFDKEALVFFSFNDSTLVSTIANRNGNFLLTLNNARTKNLQNYYPVQKGEKGYLLITDGQEE